MKVRWANRRLTSLAGFARILPSRKHTAAPSYRLMQHGFDASRRRRLAMSSTLEVGGGEFVVRVSVLGARQSIAQPMRKLHNRVMCGALALSQLLSAMSTFDLGT